jgi:hypothetical protein
MNRLPSKLSLVNLSVEEQNLAAIPFAVLERRVGKRVGKLELNGTKILPDGTEVRVLWQVQGNPELGLPTEQDLDIFVALGVLTFQNNFSKTVSFSGREIAKILNIGWVHGKFYQRLKLAMDRFIALRFRAIASTDEQEQVKWLNVFQEASFTLDKGTGRCIGSVTWTDKLIQSMDSGLFRLLDASRYMELDGITAKHLYRFLAVVFEKTDVVIIDARKLASEHLGIPRIPSYLSRLMQTLEPAFEQLRRIKVLHGWHVLASEDWTISLQRHDTYTSENRALLEGPLDNVELQRVHCRKLLEKAGIQSPAAVAFAERAITRNDLYATERAARLAEAMQEEEVIPHVAVSFIKRALEQDPSSGEGRDLLDWCEIAIEICRQKKRLGQQLRNPAGLLTKLVRDPETRRRLVSEHDETAAKERFRQREAFLLRRDEEAEQRALVLEYERFRHTLAENLFHDMPEQKKLRMREQKAEVLRQQGRFDRLSTTLRDQELDEMVIQDLATTEVPSFEKWHLRKRAEQAVLPFETELGDIATISA